MYGYKSNVSVHICHMTQAELRQMFYSRLTRNYYQGELQALYNWCVQEIQHWSRVETYLHNNEEVSEESLSRWKDAIEGWPRMSPCNMYLVPPFFLD